MRVRQLGAHLLEVAVLTWFATVVIYAALYWLGFVPRITL